jgi:hypothetical protein
MPGVNAGGYGWPLVSVLSENFSLALSIRSAVPSRCGTTMGSAS